MNNTSSLIKTFEDKMKSDLKEVFDNVLKRYNYILPVSAKSRSGAEISDYLEDGFVQYLEEHPHERIYNAKGSPKGATKNPYDFCFCYRSDKPLEFDDLVWGDIKATKRSYKDSNPDLGTPTKVIKFMLDGHFYLVFVFFEYDSTEDGQTKFLKFDDGEYIHIMFLKDINSSVRINPKPQFQCNIHEPEQYRTKKEFIDLFLKKYKESNDRIINIQMKKKASLDSTFDKIKKVQFNKNKKSEK
jgi:hypothetical protein